MLTIRKGVHKGYGLEIEFIYGEEIFSYYNLELIFLFGVVWEFHFLFNIILSRHKENTYVKINL